MPAETRVWRTPCEFVIKNLDKDDEDDLITVKLCKENQVSIGTWDGYNDVYLTKEEWPEIVKTVELMFEAQGE